MMHSYFLLIVGRHILDEYDEKRRCYVDSFHSCRWRYRYRCLFVYQGSLSSFSASYTYVFAYTEMWGNWRSCQRIWIIAIFPCLHFQLYSVLYEHDKSIHMCECRAVRNWRLWQKICVLSWLQACFSSFTLISLPVSRYLDTLVYAEQWGNWKSWQRNWVPFIASFTSLHDAFAQICVLSSGDIEDCGENLNLSCLGIRAFATFSIIY